MRQHVVHLAGDPLPLGAAALLQLPAVLAPIGVGAHPQRQHELAPGTDAESSGHDQRRAQ